MKKTNAILNNDQVKFENRMAALNFLRRRGKMSRSELSSRLGCDGTTVTHIIRYLLEKGFVKSLGCLEAEGKRGRPKEMITLKEDFQYAAGITFMPGKLIGTVIDFTGKTKFQERIIFEKDISRELFVRHLLDLATRLLDNAGEKLLGLGIATFGAYSQNKKIITQAEYFPAVCAINFEELFKDKFGIIPDITDGTFTQAALEAWNKKSEGRFSFILMNASIGVGFNIFIDSKPLLTRRGCYNESGHFIFNPQGDICEMGHHGCLETYAGIPAIERKLKAKLNIQNIDFSFIANEYKVGNRTVTETVNEAALYLGLAAANLINLFCPEEIIISGMVLDFGDEFIERFRESVMKNAIQSYSEDLKIKILEKGDDASAEGAAIIQLQKFFSQETPSAYPEIWKN